MVEGSGTILVAGEPDVRRGGHAVADVITPALLEPGATNPIGRMLGLLGDEWTLLIIRESLLGTARFADFAANLSISNAVLTARLQNLTREGLLTRRVYQDNPQRAEYLPTAHTRALWPMMLSVWHWEKTWAGGQSSALPAIHHRGCGRGFSPILGCRACELPVGSADVDVDWGPSGGWQRSLPTTTTRRRAAGSAQPGLFPQTMAIFGNRGAAAVLGAAFLGTHRFSDFHARLAAPTGIIADRLRAFVEIGVAETVAQSRRPDLAEYRLTDKGRAFFPVLAEATWWADTFFRAPEGPALLVRHRACGERFTPVLSCDRCDRTLAGNSIEARDVDAEGSSRQADAS